MAIDFSAEHAGLRHQFHLYMGTILADMHVLIAQQLNMTVKFPKNKAVFSRSESLKAKVPSSEHFTA